MKTTRFLLLVIAIFTGITSNAINVTFRVDMAQQTVPPEGVHIAGSFQGWIPEATLMTLETGSIYSYTIDLTAGETVEYKFINGDAWGEDESVPAACNQNNNRYLTVPNADIILDAVCFGSCFPCGNPTEVTFQVDMSEQTVAASGVHVAGSFQGWNPGSTEMILTANNIYAITLTVSENDNLEFKYINGNDWPGEETVPANCGVPNGVGGFNRSYLVPIGGGTLPAVCFGSCEPCGFIPNEVEVTFSVDMSEESVSPNGVHIVGAFQGWDPAADAMTDIGDGLYQATFTLISGNHYQYKFINGNTWEEEEVVPQECGEDNGQGGFNRFVNVPDENLTLDAVCYSSCNPCGYVPVEVLVTFRVDLSEDTVSANGVHLTGEFQGWDPAATEMTDVGNGLFETTVTLWSGTYHQFKYINGNTWDDEEIVPAECGDDNGQGGFNRYLIVPDVNIILDTVCFSSCEPCDNGTGVGIVVANSENYFYIIPNPFKNTLSIQFLKEENRNVKISVLNVYGKVVYTDEIENLNSGKYVFDADIESLSNGVYFCRLEFKSGNRSITEIAKIIKQ
jgi:hypothetical protein